MKFCFEGVILKINSHYGTEMDFQIGNLICTFSNPLVGAIKSRIVSAVGADADDLEKEYWRMKEFSQ